MACELSAIQLAACLSGIGKEQSKIKLLQIIAQLTCEASEGGGGESEIFISSLSASAVLAGVASDAVMWTVTIPGGTLGPNGWLECHVIRTQTGAATLRFKLNSTDIMEPYTDTPASAVLVRAFNCLHSNTVKAWAPTSLGAGTAEIPWINGAGAPSSASVDTSVDSVFTITGTIPGATSLTIEAAQIRAFYGA